MPSQTFDEVLGLEEQFYDDGYKQGLADGIKAGRIEGRTFGLEKGFEKYVESGKLHGRSIVWSNRILPKSEPSQALENEGAKLESQTSQLPKLSSNSRLAKHVTVLYALAESESLSTENSEEAVSDFDDRFKRAQAKAKIIERMAGETKGDVDGDEVGKSSKDGSIEDVSVLSARH